MSAIQARLKKARISLIAKILVLPLVAGAVLGAESLQKFVSRGSSEIQDEESLDDTFRSHFIRLDQGNKFGGTITGIDAKSGVAVGIPGLKVYLVKRSQIIRETQTKGQGDFEMSGLDPGTYSFCVAGRNGFLAYGIHLVEPAPDTSEEDIDVDSGEQDLEIQTSWNVAAPLKVTAAVVPPEFRALRQIMSDLLPSSVSGSVGYGSDRIRINVEKSVSAGGFKINLSKEGKLRGRLAPVASRSGEPIQMQEMNVFLIQDDEVYARATVAQDGTFEMLDIEPGVYGFAAAGKEGFAALSFEAVVAGNPDDENASVDSADGTVYTSKKPLLESSKLEVAICPPDDFGFLKAKIDELVDGPAVPDFGPDPFGGPPPPGGPGGPISGFGPGGLVPAPGGGRLFRFAFAGGLILGIIAVADDDNSNLPPDPTSPIN